MSTPLPECDRDLAIRAYTDLCDWRDSQATKNPQPYSNGLLAAADLIKYGNVPNIATFLPFFLSLKGKPFSLENFFPFEPMYRIKDIPTKVILRCGRQVSKSTSLAASSVLRSAATPYLNTLSVAPLFEQIRKFSNNYVRPFIEESPIRHILIGEGRKDNSVFQRTFANQSNLFFTFAYLDAERVRGISADILNLDEIQDIDVGFLPVLQSCLDASAIGLVNMSGTPKTTDNTIDYFWDQSSQAHWVTKCHSCEFWNEASLDQHLDGMVLKEGLGCYKCGCLIDPRSGHYQHRFHDRINIFPGYHVPQVVLPMHYADERKWYNLYNKKLTWPTYRYHNEVLGESCDSGSRLVTRTDLMDIANLDWENNIEAALPHVSSYHRLIMGVDWGLGAAGQIVRKRGALIVQGGTASFTVVSVVGFKAGSIEPHLLWAYRMPVNVAPEEEVRLIMNWYYSFRCSLLAHDYGGAGMLRETMLQQAGFRQDQLMPCSYTHAPSKAIVVAHPPSTERARWYWSVDKTRSLSVLCSAIKAKMVRLPKWPEVTDSEPCIYEDFLSLIEEHIENRKLSDLYLISRDPKKTDDFCHSLNLACVGYWHSSQAYPDLAGKFNIRATARADGEHDQEW